MEWGWDYGFSIETQCNMVLAIQLKKPTESWSNEINNDGEYGNNYDKKLLVIGESFCLINICLSLSDDANKIKTLNIERA